jgi:hypothetical protein
LFPDDTESATLESRYAIEAGEFSDLVRMWRLDHPEPPKRHQIPAGHLGHEESGD